MCYDIAYLTRKDYKYGSRFTFPDGIIGEGIPTLQLKYPAYYVSGFSHPDLPVVTAEENYIQAFSWGLIPFWVKSSADAVKISNQCLNARGESIFEKPSFREAAKQRRCLITCIDGFYEHHHYENKTYPFFIRLKNNEPMTFAGLWERWEDKSRGTMKHTVTIVTTAANELMSTIHNNERALQDGPRMPVLLPTELEKNWLRPYNDKSDKELIAELIKPYDADEMEAWPVKQLKGKHGVGNSEEAMKYFEYQELPY